MEIWNGLIAHPTLSTWRFGFEQIWCHGRHVWHPSQRQAFCKDWLKCFEPEILDTKYERTDVVEVVKGLTHLKSHQKEDLLWVRRTTRCLMEHLEFIHIKKVHIDIDPKAKPVHSRPHPIPWIHLKTFKMELNHLARIGVLASQQESEWASPSFIIPKKDGRVR